MINVTDDPLTILADRLVDASIAFREAVADVVGSGANGLNHPHLQESEEAMRLAINAVKQRRRMHKE